MALNDKVMEDYFSRSKKNLAALRLPIANTSHIRVFDEPAEAINTSQNLRQIQDKISDNVNTNIERISDKPRTNLEPVLEKPKTKLRTIHRTNVRQISDKIVSLTSFSSLVGLQRKITLYIYEICKFSRDKITPPILIQDIADNCDTTKLSAQKTIQRLEKKKIIIRVEYKIGRSGWTRYELSETIYQDIMLFETRNQIMSNVGQTSDKVRTESRSESRTNVVSSSSINNIYKTTTTDPKVHLDLEQHENSFSDEWQSVNFEPLLEIGFSISHLRQIVSLKKFTPEEIALSIDAFAFDLKENNRQETLKKDPLNYFMGVLRNGVPYAPPSNYEPAQIRALRAYTERQREVQQRCEAVENESIQLAFNDWVNGLTADEKEQLIPEHMRKIKSETLKNAALRSYFETHIWLTQRQQLIETFSQREEEGRG